MQVTVETTENLERHLTITVPADKIDAAVNAELRNIAKTRRFDGFRKGKVPLKIVSRMYGKSVREDIIPQVMHRHFIEAINNEKINPAGIPTFDPITDEEGKDFIFKASFEIYPEIEIKDLDKIEIVKPIATVTDEDVAQMLETLRSQNATWAEVEVPVEDSMRVTIDFTGTIDGEEFDGGKAQNFLLVLGQGRMIPGFETDFIGKVAGDEFTVDVTFPEDYHAEKLKGKAAQFAIKLHKVEAKQLPEFTEEFVQRFGVPDGSVESLKVEVQKNMERELKQKIKSRIKEQVVDGLISTNAIFVPKALVDHEVDDLRKKAASRFGGTEKNAPELPRNLFEEQAIKRVKIGLLLGEVIENAKLKADEERVYTLIEEMASAYEEPSEVIKHYQNDKHLMENMRNLALEEQAIDYILAKAKLIEKEQNFSELMNIKQA